MNPGLVILTGAGISAESGLQTFRASDGLWCGHRVETVATPQAFDDNPGLVQAFYNERRRQLADVRPNAAHLALAHLASQWRGDFLLVTQNVDDLHDRAHQAIPALPTFHLIHMHGELLKARDTRTGEIEDRTTDIPADSHLRPHIVWFGEMPLDMARIERALEVCSIFVSIGTSGNVYPAAGFTSVARRAGAKTVELNLEPSLTHKQFDQSYYGRASLVVPEFVDRLLKAQGTHA